MPAETTFVPATILGVHATNDSPVVLLRDAEHAIDRTLVIFIDYSQAHIIRAGLTQERVQRPMTHDLLLAVLTHLGSRIEKVVIEDMAQSTFYASLYVRTGDEVRRFDARPSDCIALAVRCDARVEVSRKLMRDAGVPQADIRFRDEAEEERAAVVAERVPPPRGPTEVGPTTRLDVENVLMTSLGPQVFLAADEKGEKVLTIPVEPTQALNIQLALEGQLSPRPMTHDLFSQVLNELGAIVEKVVIEDLQGETFYAGLYVQMESGGAKGITRFDARPSDCIALAVRVGAPIEVATHVMATASIPRSAIRPAPRVQDDEDADLGVER